MQAPTEVPAVSIKNISKVWPRTHALDNVSFDIPQRTVFGLLGPNGAGKTTLFSTIAGFLKPTAGRIEVLGIDIDRVSELRGRLSILPQDALFQANVPVLEQLVFFCQLTGFTRHEAEAEALRALGLVGLTDQAKKNARLLSHGMTKRMGIAQAFLGKPEVILLDEPTAGLDPVNARGVRDLIKSIKTTGTLIVSSHDMREIQEMCSHVAILDRGKLALCDTVEAITGAGSKVRMAFPRPLTSAELATIQAISGVTKVQVSSASDSEFLITVDGKRKQEDATAEIVAKLAANGLVPRSVASGESLETRFLEVTDEKKPRS